MNRHTNKKCLLGGHKDRHREGFFWCNVFCKMSNTIDGAGNRNSLNDNLKAVNHYEHHQKLFRKSYYIHGYYIHYCIHTVGMSFPAHKFKLCILRWYLKDTLLFNLRIFSGQLFQ